MITAQEKQRFETLCEADLPAERQGIGQYQEKSLHRICKRFVTCEDREESYEVKVGPYVADVMEFGHITEIQCGPFRPLREKLAFYRDEGYSVTVLHPVLADFTVLRADRETGEILRKRRFRTYERPIDVLPLLYDLRDLLAKQEFTLCLLLIRAEEFRYSERVRYRKSGAYEAELFPRELLEILTFEKKEDYRLLLPQGLPNTFSATEFGTLAKLKGRRLYSALNVLTQLGILLRTKEGRSYRYQMI